MVKFLKSFFWGTDFVIVCCFNGNARNQHNSFGWIRKPLVPFWRDYSSSDNYLVNS